LAAKETVDEKPKEVETSAATATEETNPAPAAVEEVAGWFCGEVKISKTFFHNFEV